MSTLVLLRHGQSTWNEQNLFTGWTDVDLTPLGEHEARAAGALLAQAGVVPTVAHTSVLTRAVRTANLALDVMDLSWIPIRRHWRLNERHYGALQGLNKKDASAEFGAEQVKAWRRGYATPPPALDPGDERHPCNDARYRQIPERELPATECLADVVARSVPYFVDAIAPDLVHGEVVLVVAHGNSLRALVKYLDTISDDDIAGVEIPTGIPLVYELDDALEPLTPLAGAADLAQRYLGDPEAVRAAQAAVAAQAG